MDRYGSWRTRPCAFAHPFRLARGGRPVGFGLRRGRNAGTNVGAPNGHCACCHAHTGDGHGNPGRSNRHAGGLSDHGGTGGLDAVCAKGVTEGAVSIWIDIDPELYAAETAPFVAKYPEIKITEMAIRPTDSVPKVITDVTTGHAPETDIVQGEPPLLDPLVQRGLIDTSFDWTSFGQGSDLVLNGMLRHYRVFRGLGYNTQTVPVADLPTTYEGLIDAKWAGQIVVDPRGYTFQDLGVAWGEEKILDYARRMKSIVNPLVLKGITDDTTATASGQVKLNTNARDAETAEQKAKGAPIDIKYLDYVIVDDSYNAVVKGAQHPNAAACLIAWMNSKDGLDLQFQQEYKSNADTLPTLEPNTILVTSTRPKRRRWTPRSPRRSPTSGPGSTQATVGAASSAARPLKRAAAQAERRNGEK